MCSGYHSLNHSWLGLPHLAPWLKATLSCCGLLTSSTAAASRALLQAQRCRPQCRPGPGACSPGNGRLPLPRREEEGRPRPRDTLGSLGSLRGGGAPGAGERPCENQFVYRHPGGVAEVLGCRIPPEDQSEARAREGATFALGTASGRLLCSPSPGGPVPVRGSVGTDRLTDNPRVFFSF